MDLKTITLIGVTFLALQNNIDIQRVEKESKARIASLELEVKALSEYANLESTKLMLDYMVDNDRTTELLRIDLDKARIKLEGLK